LERTRGWGGTYGGSQRHCFAIQLINKKKIKKTHHSLRWPRINVFDATTNQKHAGVTAEVQGKRFDGGGAQGNGNAIILGAIELGRGKKINKPTSYLN
jgi:hypothetical protein